jgi:mannose-6-phosphate isomerase
MASSGTSSLSTLAPFRIEPRFVGRVWGFKDLRPWYDKVAADEPLGEVWLTGDECVVATGPRSGKTLASVFAEFPKVMLGDSAPDGASPLLIKVIFAKEKLSVQVHPDDRLAQKYGQPRGKTECWLALAADAGAQVAAGLKPGVTLEQIKEEIHAGTLEQSLNVVDISAGDMVFVDAGTVHAIWPGSILLETQQNCDLTYRMFDYGRPRELHIDKSLEATRLVTRAGKIPPKVLSDRTILLDVEYFRVERIPVSGNRSSATLAADDRKEPGLAYLFASSGTGRVTGPGFEPVDLPARSIVAVPAASPSFRIEDTGGLDLIRMTPNWPAARQ